MTNPVEETSDASAYEQLTRQQVVQVEKKIAAVEKRIENALEKIFEELKELRNRLPVWATLLVSFLFLLVGASFTAILVR